MMWTGGYFCGKQSFLTIDYFFLLEEKNISSKFIFPWFSMSSVNILSKMRKSILVCCLSLCVDIFGRLCSEIPMDPAADSREGVLAHSPGWGSNRVPAGEWAYNVPQLCLLEDPIWVMLFHIKIKGLSRGSPALGRLTGGLTIISSG